MYGIKYLVRICQEFDKFLDAAEIDLDYDLTISEVMT